MKIYITDQFKSIASFNFIRFHGFKCQLVQFVDDYDPEIDGFSEDTAFECSNYSDCIAWNGGACLKLIFDTFDDPMMLNTLGEYKYKGVLLSYEINNYLYPGLLLVEESERRLVNGINGFKINNLDPYVLPFNCDNYENLTPISEGSVVGGLTSLVMNSRIYNIWRIMHDGMTTGTSDNTLMQYLKNLEVDKSIDGQLLYKNLLISI